MGRSGPRLVRIAWTTPVVILVLAVIAVGAVAWGLFGVGRETTTSKVQTRVAITPLPTMENETAASGGDDHGNGTESESKVYEMPLIPYCFNCHGHRAAVERRPLNATTCIGCSAPPNHLEMQLDPKACMKCHVRPEDMVKKDEDKSEGCRLTGG